MESVGNPNVPLDPWLPQLLNMLHPREPDLRGPGRSSVGRVPSLDMWSLASMARAFHEPWNHYDDLVAGYATIMDGMARLRAKQAELLSTTTTTSTPSKALRACNVHLSLAASVALIHNRMLQEFDTQDAAALRVAADALMDEMLGYGEQALPYKPLGASHALPGLNITWALTDDSGVRTRASDMVREIYSCGFPAPGRTREPWWWQMKFAHVGRQIRRRERSRNNSPGLLEGGDEVFEHQCHTQ